MELFVRDIPEGLTLDPITGGRPVFAAYMSAAHILRRVIARRLDIDPVEIEMSSIQRRRIGN